MNTKSFAIATTVGGITFFILSFIIYGMILPEFFTANAGSATGVFKDPPNFISLFLGELAFGALYSFIFLKWAKISTFKTGLKGGAIIGLLLGLGFDLINFGTANLLNLTGTLVDVLVATISGALAGGVIGWIIGKIN